MKAIRSETALPIGTVILTHSHPDHVLGARPLLEDGGSVIGHAALAAALSARGPQYVKDLQSKGLDDLSDADIVLPDTGVELVRTISLGDRELILSAHPTAHSGTDLTVLDMATGTLIMGDLLFSGRTPSVDGSVAGWKRLLQEMRQLPAERAVPGHGPVALPWPEGTKPLLRYLETLINDTQAELDQGTPMSEAVKRIAAGERGRWLFFETSNTQNAMATFQEMQQE